jgi:hypothetical protein
LLHPSELQDDINGARLKLILEIQSELDQSLHAIGSIAAGITQKPVSSATRADDQDLKEFKEFRRRGLSYTLHSLHSSLHSIFRNSSYTIKELTKPPTVTIEPHQHPQSSCRDAILFGKTSTARIIDQVIKWVTAHEWILIPTYWGPKVNYAHDGFVSDLSKAIYRAIPHLKPTHFSNGLARRLRSKHALPLAQCLIPLIKLSRVFFNRLANDVLMKKIPSKPFTDMSSNQLETLCNSIGYIAHDFYDLIRTIATYESDVRNDETPHPASIEGIINKIISRFDSNVLLVITYIIPLIPDSVSEPNHFQTYLVEWRKLCLIAAQRCIHAVQLYNAASLAAELHE